MRFCGTHCCNSYRRTFSTLISFMILLFVGCSTADLALWNKIPPVCLSSRRFTGRSGSLLILVLSDHYGCSGPPQLLPPHPAICKLLWHGGERSEWVAQARTVSVTFSLLDGPSACLPKSEPQPVCPL